MVAQLELLVLCVPWTQISCYQNKFSNPQGVSVLCLWLWLRTSQQEACCASLEARSTVSLCGRLNLVCSRISQFGKGLWNNVTSTFLKCPSRTDARWMILSMCLHSSRNRTLDHLALQRPLTQGLNSGLQSPTHQLHQWKCQGKCLPGPIPPQRHWNIGEKLSGLILSKLWGKVKDL